MEKVKIGFIGTGVMGKSMAANLMQAGYELFVYTRTAAKAQALIQLGAKWRESPKTLADEVDVVISMVGYPADVEAIYLGKDGILAALKAGAYIIDMTTSSPQLAVSIAEKAASKGIKALDAPVSGGDIGAKEARLAIMVGGQRADYEAMLPVFEAMGKTISYFGKAGAGQCAKMSNQIAIASNMMGVCEALAYAEKCGLDPKTVLKTIETGAAGSWSLSNLGPRMLKGDYDPGFFIKHFIKDMKIAIESAEAMNLDLPGLKLAKTLYDELAYKGKEKLGTQALLQWYSQK